MNIDLSLQQYNTYHSEMSKTLIMGILLITVIYTIQIPLHKGPRCMIIETQFEPIKLQLRFPRIPNKQENQKFKITLLDFETEDISFQVLVQEATLYRKNLQLEEEKLYHLCVEVWTNRRSFNPSTEQMYADYTADEDFDALIGTIEVPEELKGQNNLQILYNVSESITRINKKIVEHQTSERQIQDDLASSSLHKNQRIVTLTIIQCCVIVLSGLYQVFALRRFLIEKNLY